ncbi:MAG: protein-export chaperone SecB [Deltaproteobacteria bacterium]|nr:protein-export chaperone SecB [Deltaproteobacteria bacterium]
MGGSGIKSEFSFLSYKIDKIDYSILQDIGVVQFNCNYKNCEWQQKISIRNPVFFKSQKVYLCGVNSTMKLINHNNEEDKKRKTWLTLKTGIVGLFAIGDRLDEESEKKFVTVGAPALLFPYLRAACSNILASSGFGSVVMPLVNMHKVGIAFAAKEDFSILVQE